MRKLKYVKLFENFMINEDILELDSFVNKLYSFLKEKKIEVELKKEMGSSDTFDRWHTIGGKDDAGDFWKTNNYGIQIYIANSFPGVNFKSRLHKDGPFIAVSLNKYTGQGVDKLIEEFTSKFPEVVISEKKTEDEARNPGSHLPKNYSDEITFICIREKDRVN
jgi:hypothetical protein